MGVRGWLAVLALAIVVASVTFTGRHDEVRQAAAGGGADVVLIDADRHGAIVVDGRTRAAMGIHRDGTVAWRLPLEPAAALPVGCLASCPDAVLSGSTASVNSPAVPDPDPVMIVAGRPRTLAEPAAPVKRRVLTANTAADLVLATADADEASLVVYRGGAAQRVDSGGWHTSWSSTVDGRHALAVTSVSAGVSRARWFDRDAGGWRPAGAAFPVAGTGSCVAPDGERAMLLGQRPQLVDRGGAGIRITGLDTAGTCALAAGGGGIVGELLLRMSGPLTRLRSFDAAGTVTWSRDLPAEARVTADPTGPRVAYVTGGSLYELDPRTGAPLRTVPDVQAAGYDETGALVVIGADLTVSWLTG